MWKLPTRGTFSIVAKQNTAQVPGEVLKAPNCQKASKGLDDAVTIMFLLFCQSSIFVHFYFFLGGVLNVSV